MINQFNRFIFKKNEFFVKIALNAAKSRVAAELEYGVISIK